MRHDPPIPPQLHEPVRAAFRIASARLIEAGRLEPIDAAIGAVYATHDLARSAGMDPAEAVEWLRTAADTMERQLMGSMQQ